MHPMDLDGDVEIFGAKDHGAAEPAQRERRAHDRRQADFFEDGARFLDGVRIARARRL